MSLSRRIATVLAAVAIMLTGSMVATTATQAAPVKTQTSNSDSTHAGPIKPAWWEWHPILSGSNSCPAGYICIWQDQHFGGAGRAYRGNVIPFEEAQWLGSGFENRVGSAWNRGSVRIYFLNYLGPVDRWQNLGGLDPGYSFEANWSGARYCDGMEWRG